MSQTRLFYLPICIDRNSKTIRNQIINYNRYLIRFKTVRKLFDTIYNRLPALRPLYKWSDNKGMVLI